jgi:hypothetical protein
VTDASFKAGDEPQPALLTRKATDVLVRIERLLDDANHALEAQSGPAGTLGALDKDNNASALAAADHGSAELPRGD